MYHNISEKKLFYNFLNSLFYLEFATAESRGCFMRKLRFMGNRIQAI